MINNSQPNIAQIRRLLNQAFDDPSLDSFCQDYFPSVFDRFSRGMRKDEKITLLLDHCRRISSGFEALRQAVYNSYEVSGFEKNELKALADEIATVLEEQSTVGTKQDTATPKIRQSETKKDESQKKNDPHSFSTTHATQNVEDTSAVSSSSVEEQGPTLQGRRKKWWQTWPAYIGGTVVFLSGLATILTFLFGDEIVLRVTQPFATPTAALVAASNPSATPTFTASSVPTLISPSTATPTLTPAKSPTATPTVPTATPTPSPTPDAILRNEDGATMVFVPAGEFLMGSTPEDIDKFTGLCRQECQRSDFEDELNQHSISVEAFWIDETEVTNGQYKRCMEMGQCNPSEFAEDSNLNGDNQPVVGVSWKDALTYCEWVGARLPTEAEWEKAARGTEGDLYPWGDVFTSEIVNYGYQHGTTLPVKTLDNASPYKAYDMVGNVWEWTGSLYQSYNYDANDGRENLESNDPHVVRGGAWLNEAGFVHAASRSGEATDHRYGRIGFRCARSEQ